MAQKALHETTGLADSPCIGVCTVSQWGTRTCKGCGRTANEIREWNSYSDFEKKLIVLRCWEDYLPRQKREAQEQYNKSKNND